MRDILFSNKHIRHLVENAYTYISALSNCRLLIKMYSAERNN